LAGHRRKQRAEAHALIAKAKHDAAKASEARLAAASSSMPAWPRPMRACRRRAEALAEIETVASEAAGDIVARLAGITVVATPPAPP
jgi:F-type H+-transporting ATPase subunit b